MSVKLGNIPIAGLSERTKYNAHHLLDFKWSDCIMNDVSWLRADTFSWQDGGIYVAAYNHLVADLQGATLNTETIGGITINYWRSVDKHIIVTADQESKVIDIYNATGIGWYYILDTTNTRFKFPRSKWGFTGLRTNAGDTVEAGLPNITGEFDCSCGDWFKSGAFYQGDYFDNSIMNQTQGSTYKIGFDASRSSSIYGNSTTVQPPATQMYLYFYVGDFSQTATEQTAGLNSELFIDKVDLNLANTNNSGTSRGAGWAMPSGTYEDLTFGASDTSYIAPANGWVLFSRYATDNSYGWTILRVLKENQTTVSDANTLYRTDAHTNTQSTVMTCFMPVKKGQTFFITYGGASANLLWFRFIYAQGSESEA